MMVEDEAGESATLMTTGASHSLAAAATFLASGFWLLQQDGAWEPRVMSLLPRYEIGLSRDCQGSTLGNVACG